MPQLSKKQFFAALVLSLCFLFCYEAYWRNYGLVPGHNMSAEMWTKWRRQVKNLKASDIIILGSSRAFFNINVHLFEELSGKRPIMLAIEGGTPFDTYQDIIENTDFNGTIICGVAPGLFFTLPDSWTSKRVRNNFVEFANKQTYASQFNQWTFEFFDPHLAYIHPDFTLQRLIDKIPLENRDSVNAPTVWPPMVAMDEYRSIRMLDWFEQDTVLQRRQKNIWFDPTEELDTVHRYADTLQYIIQHYDTLTEKFNQRGGQIAFLFSPISGKYLEESPMVYPRAKYWDELLRKTESIGYHYEDYPVIRDMEPPEWSHLSKSQSDVFTTFLVEQLTKDGLL